MDVYIVYWIVSLDRSNVIIFMFLWFYLDKSGKYLSDFVYQILLSYLRIVVTMRSDYLIHKGCEVGCDKIIH